MAIATLYRCSADGLRIDFQTAKIPHASAACHTTCAVLHTTSSARYARRTHECQPTSFSFIRISRFISAISSRDTD